MESKEHIPSENMKLLMEIFTLKNNLSELIAKTGPNNSNYINLSIKLKVLEQEFIDQKISLYKDELEENRIEFGPHHQKIMEASPRYNKKMNMVHSWSFMVKR